MRETHSHQCGGVKEPTFLCFFHDLTLTGAFDQDIQSVASSAAWVEFSTSAPPSRGCREQAKRKVLLGFKSSVIDDLSVCVNAVNSPVRMTASEEHWLDHPNPRA